jgi:hypothetical protein
MPEDEAINVLLRLRKGGDVATLVREVKGGCLLLQLAQDKQKYFPVSFLSNKMDANSSSLTLERKQVDILSS